MPSALLAVTLLVAGFSEPEHVVESRRTADISFATARLLGRSFCMAAAFGAAMMLARFSEAFLIVKASAAGLSTAYVPLVMVVMSGVYTFATYPAGALSDRSGRRGLLVAGIVVLIAADLVLGLTLKIAPMFIGVAPGVCTWV